MKRRLCLSVGFAMLCALLLIAALSQAQASGPGAPESPYSASATAPGAMPIQGILTDNTGKPVPDGNYTITFRIYSVESGGTAMCSDANSVSVQNGRFNSVVDNCWSAITGMKLWLGVQEGSDAEMIPRQVLLPVPYALSLRPGADISGTIGADPILHVESWGTDAKGLRSYAMPASGTTYGLIGASRSPAGYGGYLYNSGGGIGLWAQSDGVLGAAIRAENTGSGMAIWAESNSSGTLVPTLSLVQSNAAGNFIVGASSLGGTRQFRVDRSGIVYASSYQVVGADFAEQLAVSGVETAYEPGDVLVISESADEMVELSGAPFSTAVVGVYSTKPAVLGGAPDGDDPLAGIPVAVVGIVPCKVVDEGGAIRRGDLLVTSSIQGRAMRAGANPPAGAVLGKALQGWEHGSGVIQIVVTLQ